MHKKILLNFTNFLIDKIFVFSVEIKYFFHFINALVNFFILLKLLWMQTWNIFFIYVFESLKELCIIYMIYNDIMHEHYITFNIK